MEHAAVGASVCDGAVGPNGLVGVDGRGDASCGRLGMAPGIEFAGLATGPGDRSLGAVPDGDDVGKLPVSLCAWCGVLVRGSRARLVVARSCRYRARIHQDHPGHPTCPVVTGPPPSPGRRNPYRSPTGCARGAIRGYLGDRQFNRPPCEYGCSRYQMEFIPDALRFGVGRPCGGLRSHSDRSSSIAVRGLPWGLPSQSPICIQIGSFCRWSRRW